MAVAVVLLHSEEVQEAIEVHQVLDQLVQDQDILDMVIVTIHIEPVFMFMDTLVEDMVLQLPLLRAASL